MATPGGPQPGRCSHFVQRKRRFCKMEVSDGRRFCGEHAGDGEDQYGRRRRIPCPLDPKHTIYEDQLEKHLTKCNSREKPKPVFYVQDVNSSCENTEPSSDQISLCSLSKEELQNLTEKLKQVTSGLTPPLVNKKLCHWALLEALNDPKNGESASKHLKQQGSILGHLESLCLLGGSRYFVEFGAGRGKLSHWVDIAIQGAENVHFLLVERATTRFKVDGKPRKSTFERLQIDIQHLCLERVPILKQKQLPIIGIGKHLCGAGTDLALRCLLQSYSHPDESWPKRPRTNMVECRISEDRETKSARHPTVEGIVIALCCHHRCDWYHYVGKDFFHSLGLGHREFSLFQRMSSWATCGMRRLPSKGPQSTEQAGIENKKGHEAENQDFDSHSEAIQGLLTAEERESLGRLCKLLIDYGRLDYLKQMGYRAVLQYYTEPEVSLENVLLTAIPQ